MPTSPATTTNTHRLVAFPERFVPRRLTVSSEHSADYASIQEAINDARPGDTIALDAGMYLESIVVDKPVHFVGPNDPRFAGEEMESDDEAPCAMIIGLDDDAVIWAASGGSIRDIAISRVDRGEEPEEGTAVVRLVAGTLELKRCVIADGAQMGVCVTDGKLDITRCHIRNVATGISLVGGTANITRTHVEGFDTVAASVEHDAAVVMEDNSFEGRTVLRGTVKGFSGNDIDTLFVHETMSTAGNRIGSLVHIFEFRSVGGVAVGI